jgi:hypothetical protein
MNRRTVFDKRTVLIHVAAKEEVTSFHLGPLTPELLSLETILLTVALGAH